MENLVKEKISNKISVTILEHSEENQIPLDDLEAWTIYPKYNWTYNSIQLLDKQSVKWSPFLTETENHRIPLYGIEDSKIENHHIYIGCKNTNEFYTECILLKGELKQMNCFSITNGKFELIKEQNISGNLELKISALITMNFQKYTGVIGFKSVDDTVIAMKIRPNWDLPLYNDESFNKKIVKLYSRKQWK